MHAQVKSSSLEKWRKDNGGVADGANLWIAQVGYLSPAQEYLKWQLANPADREAEIQSMIDTVRHLVLPAFDACSSQESLSTQLLERRELTRVPDWARDIALWIGNKKAATGLIKILLETRPDLAAAVHAEYTRQRHTPLEGAAVNRYQAFVR